jgi:nucleoside-diphosphate-sugar epimerase
MSKVSSITGDVVVTGGAGAIGSRLVRRLLDDGARRIVVIDDFSSGYRWLLPSDSRVEVLAGDACDIAAINPAVRNPLVFHLAAFFANQNSVDHPQDDLHTNGLGTLATLMWARDNRARRLVYASAGCSIAGHGIDAPIREDMPVSLHMDTPYQITKTLGEFYCNYFNESVSTVRCRFFNSYGPGELPGRYRNVIPNFIWLAMHDEPLTITGTGHETRDFIYVDDLVEGLIRAATVSSAGGGAFNLGTGIQTTIVDLANLIIKMCSSKSRVVYAPRRPWDHSLHREADITKAKDELQFSPATPLAAGLERTIQWFTENRQHIEKEVRAFA